MAFIIYENKILLVAPKGTFKYQPGSGTPDPDCCCPCCNCDSVPDTLFATLDTGGAVPGLDGVIVPLTRTAGGPTTGTWTFSGTISCGDTWDFELTCDTSGVECVAADPSHVTIDWSSTSILGPGTISRVGGGTQCPLEQLFRQGNSGYSGACGVLLSGFTLDILVTE